MNLSIKHTLGLLFLTLILQAFSISTEMQAQREIVIEGYDDMSYSVTEIKAEPGEELKVVMKTISDLPESQMAHNFILLKKDVYVRSYAVECAEYPDNDYIVPGSQDKIIAMTDMVAGGESDAVVFEAPEEPGEYTYVCTFPGHYLGGMKGTLIVEE